MQTSKLKKRAMNSCRRLLRLARCGTLKADEAECGEKIYKSTGRPCNRSFGGVLESILSQDLIMRFREFGLWKSRIASRISWRQSCSL